MSSNTSALISRCIRCDYPILSPDSACPECGHSCVRSTNVNRRYFADSTWAKKTAFSAAFMAFGVSLLLVAHIFDRSKSLRPVLDVAAIVDLIGIYLSLYSSYIATLVRAKKFVTKEPSVGDHSDFDVAVFAAFSINGIIFSIFYPYAAITSRLRMTDVQDYSIFHLYLNSPNLIFLHTPIIGLSLQWFIIFRFLWPRRSGLIFLFLPIANVAAFFLLAITHILVVGQGSPRTPFGNLIMETGQWILELQFPFVAIASLATLYKVTLGRNAQMKETSPSSSPSTLPL